ncbi:MAG TPA: glutamine amidotransferase [Vicinamibacterales bacterium]|nr:glutamine amidotransferase [Vicinamibacterales bacterium]
MFKFLFKYPWSTFSRGHFVLLGAWPAWMLGLSIVVVSSGLALLIRAKLTPGDVGSRKFRVAGIWLLQSMLAALLLLLLWQPAITTAELKPQQDIIVFLVDDSRSMTLAENGTTRQAQAIAALGAGVLTGVEKRFQTRLYRFDRQAGRIANLKELHGSVPATRIGDSLKQIAAETQELPVGAIVLLTDGADNSGGIDADTIAALRSRHIPVHTVGFGADHATHDVEVDDAVMAPRAMADSRLGGVVRFHQYGYGGRKGKIVVRDGTTILASHEVTLGPDGAAQSDTLLFNVGAAGAKALQFSIEPLPGEESAVNNSVSRIVNVESDKRRVLYLEGEPRWEYKFVRRAEEDDRIVQLVSMLRTTENKIYRQGVQDPKELAEGFPTRAENLFAYQALVIGSVEATYFTAAQRELIREFVDRRGGGLLLLGGRFSLADGGWGVSNLADLLPVVLPDAKGTFHVEPATVELASAGVDNYITRLVDDSAANAKRWKSLPYLMDFQEPGAPKPGATVLADMSAGGKKMPMLTTENFGRGRTAVLATSGTWRWQMNSPVGDSAFTLFWQQLLRWLVTGTPGHVTASVPNQMLLDDGRVALSAEVRGDDYQPAGDARVEAHIIGPGGVSANIEMTPTPDAPGNFQAEWTANTPGSYLTEVIALRGERAVGRDVLTFQRMDGVAENFHTGQNRELLTRLASQTGGRYWRPQDLADLPDEIAFSEAGVTTRETRELWNMPIFLLAMVLLRFTEWLLRRKWGIV